MIDLKHEIERELSLIDPPDLWDRIHAEASSDGIVAGPEPTTARRHRPSLWLAAAAVTVLLALIGAVALLDDHETVDTAPATQVPEVPEPPRDEAAPTMLAKGEDVRILDPADVGIVATGYSELVGQTLNIEAVARGGEVTGELRVNNVVVTLQCTGTRLSTGGPYSRRDLILGGEVTDDPDGQGLLIDPYGGRRAVIGDVVALIIREDDASDLQRITLYADEPVTRNDSAGSCSELVRSIRFLDGGYFNDVAVGKIETAPFSPTLAKGEDVEIVDRGMSGGLAGQTLNIDAEREDGQVTGEYRVDDVVVTLQCADTDTIDGEIRLGGEVTDDPDGQGLAVIDDRRVAVGDLVVLVIRERGPDFDQVALYADDRAGSCAELVGSVPYNLDGGFFNDVEDGDAIETGQVEFNYGDPPTSDEA